MSTPLFRRLRNALAPKPSTAARRTAVRRRPVAELLEDRQLLTVVLTVTDDMDYRPNTVDKPIVGSLRDVIQRADAVPSTSDVLINFNIEGGGFKDLQLLAPLPAITRKVALDATTQPPTVGSSAASTTPSIQIDGSRLWGQNVTGLTLASGASGSIVKGLDVTSFDNGGILLNGTQNVLLAGNDVGIKSVSVFGSVTNSIQGNGNFGIALVNGASSNTLDSDVVSGNRTNGVVITSGSSFNTVRNSKIGTDPTGLIGADFYGTSLGNGVPTGSGTGLVINQGASYNDVSNNVISENATYGVLIADPGTAHNDLFQNKIGTDAGGGKAFPNRFGVTITNQARSNFVGITGAGNTISGNAGDGVQILGSGTTLNTVEANVVGTNAAGTVALPNGGSGVAIAQGAGSNMVDHDVISGNGNDGVYISDYGTAGNSIHDDKIGTDLTGTVALPNRLGVVVQGQASSNTLANDVISGNAWDGVQFLSGASGNQVQASVIGTDATGTVALPNRGSGVAIALGAVGNTIGGPTSASRNVISGNGYDGVYVSDGGTTGNTVQFNYIGTDASGSRAVPNGSNGVIVQNGATYTYVYNDLVSGNLADGVLVTGAATANNYLSGDWIGLDGTGTRALTQPCRSFSNNVGVQISNGAYNTSVGGDVISGNNVGLEIDYGATSNWVVYDKIGTDVAGLHNVGNVGDGVILDGTSGNLIGYDLLAFNGDVGILGENGSNTSNNSLSGDAFSVTVNGATYGNKNGDTDFD